MTCGCLFPGAVDERGAMPYYAEECASMLAVTFSNGDQYTRSIVSEKSYRKLDWFQFYVISAKGMHPACMYWSELLHLSWNEQIHVVEIKKLLNWLSYGLKTSKFHWKILNDISVSLGRTSVVTMGNIMTYSTGLNHFPAFLSLSSIRWRQTGRSMAAPAVQMATRVRVRRPHWRRVWWPSCWRYNLVSPGEMCSISSSWQQTRWAAPPWEKGLF